MIALPVTITFEAVLPVKIPNIPVATIDTFATPPLTVPMRPRAKSRKKSPAPVNSSAAPKTI